MTIRIDVGSSDAVNDGLADTMLLKGLLWKYEVSIEKYWRKYI